MKYPHIVIPINISTIYCLRNPLDMNRVFYVGKTTRSLQARLKDHVYSSKNPKVRNIIDAILLAGKKPIICELEICTGQFKAHCREVYWIKKFNKGKTKLSNRQLVKKKLFFYEN